MARLFHNFIAAVGTLIDHTRSTVRALYSSDGFIEEYQAHIGEIFASDPLSHSLQDLRNYTLHRELPVPEGRLRVNPDEARSYLHLNRDALSDWDGWSRAAREYLNALTGDLDLADVASRYASKVFQLYTWLAERQGELHRDDLAEIAKLRADISAYLAQP